MDQKKELKRMKKFRSQLLSEWVSEHYTPCHVADIGGGKGLVSYLLDMKGFDSTVIDPINQALPEKYTTLDKVKTKILPDQKVKRITSPFEIQLAQGFDLLIGLHSHGSNLRIIDACKKYGTDFILIPCCIINEGIDPYSVKDWLQYVEDYANSLGIKTKRAKLNFKGQRTMIFSIKEAPFPGKHSACGYQEHL